MKKILSQLTLAVCCIACTEPVISTFGSIGGTVQDGNTGEYLSGVTINLNPLGYSQVTNTDGTFQYDNLDIAEYTLTYTKTGYETYKHKVTVKPGVVSSVQVTMSRASSTIYASPDILDFGAKTNELQLKLSCSSGSIPYTAKASNSWITINKSSGIVSGDDYITVIVSRSGLSPATYDGNIIITAEGKDISIPVKMIVSVSGVPTATIESISEITSNSVLASGTLKVIGDSKITQYGFCWSSDNSSPGLSDEHNTLGDASDIKSFNSNISGLMPQTLYYIRAYAVNSYGTSYSDTVLSFTTASSSENGGNDNNGSKNSIVVPQGLMAYYVFDNEDASDLTENELDGTLLNNPTFVSETTDGTGKALHLNGLKEQYMSIPYNVLKSLSKYTVSFWIKDFSQGIIFTVEGGNELPSLFITDTQKFELYNDYYTYVSHTNYTFAYDCTVIMSSSWHHIAVSSQDGAMVLYVDGVKTDSITEGYDTSSGSKISVGGYMNSISSYMTMKIDNLRFYQRVLSESEIKTIYDDEK